MSTTHRRDRRGSAGHAPADDAGLIEGHALLPKPRDRTRFVPVIPGIDAGLARLLGDLAPEERRTLAEIVDRSDLLMVDGKPWLLVQATPQLVERLATFQAATEDLEPDMEDELETDDDSVNDNPADKEALAEDLEDDDPREEADHPEDDDPGGTDCGEGLGTPAPMSPQMRAIDADYLARQRQR